MEHRLYDVNGGALTDVERLELARLLIKAGYTVSLGRDKSSGKLRKYIEIGGLQNE
ncbi:resolvase [Intestinimonas massiliensis]|uniref:Resolvase n=1 Tax=Intestinimonas massiliensis (ex Afouda et al. 2020) TaxID=1673721 RepID=A0AAW5JGC2_9FIRM|nr:resolvase [Intestinimonas massiliensis (ex Afouda et al. 2020)]MCQ4769023.1 resolvase [Intestinimonas massiliensis (ex Afouda et al. 2020)]MCQ4769076.1 resolvase [Intestinimonas massiliensis (ex Afouda et al. 2020)]